MHGRDVGQEHAAKPVFADLSSHGWPSSQPQDLTPLVAELTSDGHRSLYTIGEEVGEQHRPAKGRQGESLRRLRGGH